MKKRTIALLTTLAVALAIAVGIAGEANKTYRLVDFSQNPLALKCDTTQAINDTVLTSVTVVVPLGRIYQFIFNIDSTKSQSTATGEKASDSTYYKFKVQSRFGYVSNAFWADICSLTTGSSGADTGTFIMEKVLFLAADTTTDAGRIGDNFRIITTLVDSMTSAVGTDSCKVDRVYGSLQVAVRH